MGLTCRFLGHAFGDSEIEHTREERGNEVVATVKKMKTCKRCNIEQVISQNKEVTSIRPTETAEATENSEDTKTSTSSDGWESAPDHKHIRADDSTETTQDDSSVNDAVILDNESTDRDKTQWPADSKESIAVEQQNESAQEQRDDTGAEILTSTSDTDTDTDIDADTDVTRTPSTMSNAERDKNISSTRARKEWPTSGRDAVDGASPISSTSWPDPAGEDRGYTAQPDTDSVSIEFSGEGLTPRIEKRASNNETSAPVNEKVSARDETDGQTHNESETQSFTRASEVDRPRSTVPDSHVELYCPHCDHSHPADISSMRAGDICPECRSGYIHERKR
jgi:hypothetical protein